MPLKIVRNDITKMNTDAIVNTANCRPKVGSGCDTAIYEAAGYDELLAYRKEHIGFVEHGEAFITPGFHLSAKYIIHATSPMFIDGSQDEENKLRSCYQKSLQLAVEHDVKSIAFPLISTGCFGYPKEEGMRIAIDEISAFLIQHDMLIYLVVFDEKATQIGAKIYPNLEEYIDRNYVQEKEIQEYSGRDGVNAVFRRLFEPPAPKEQVCEAIACYESDDAFLDSLENALDERMEHIADTFSEYLLYLIELKGMTNAEVYKRAIVDRKAFSKIKNNPDYHPQKLTALCLCIGAKLNLDETKDLLARAGYALSPCDKTDIIFSYFIENEFYDMIELDIQLEEHGLPCIIT
ncbi:MAG: macro domain-containing protein [Eubacteriales bacterium]|nr:macro domain-containing protein [Eubacteriales bacterium]